MSDVLTPDQLSRIHAYWRAANYLSVGQIYLKENPLLEVPLERSHIKPRLLGHWGTTVGLNFIYVHLNRLIKQHDLDMIYITGPGHGGPGLLAQAYLEGSYTEVYPNIERSRSGLERLFRQFSWPYGVPSHVAPETPGSIHEGGELGYALAHAFGAAFDNPELIVACVIGDGEAETGALATSWHANKFLNPIRDGAVLPILHLNGFKIANPTILARIPRDELLELFRGYGYSPHVVEGEDPPVMHQLFAHTLDTVLAEILQIQSRARAGQPKLERPPAPDHFAHPQGLDRAEICRRQAGRGYLARPSGPDHRLRQSRAPPAARGMDEELPAARAVRYPWQVSRGFGGAGTYGPTSDGAKSTCQRWRIASASGDAEFPRLRRGVFPPGHSGSRVNPHSRRFSARHL